MRKTVWTLNINNYEPNITALTYPLMRAWAHKIGAEFRIITERKFPDFPIVYEKLQLHELGADSDWNIYLDSDALVNPEMFDPTNHLGMDTVAHNGSDMAGVRWTYDGYFRRDGRNIGSCNWCTIASNWCLDIWHPLEVPLVDALSKIHPTIGEHNSGMFTDNHLIDDYTLSRNIARYGLKFKTITDICGELGWRGPNGGPVSPFLWHMYAIPSDVKLERMLAVLGSPMDKGGWAIMTPDQVMEFKKMVETGAKPELVRA
jgi:hypothetical protein